MGKKIIITKLENIRRVEEVRYEVQVPEKVKNIKAYIDKLAAEDRLAELSSFVSSEVLKGELLDEEVLDVVVGS